MPPARAQLRPRAEASGGAGAKIGDALHAAVRGGHGGVVNDLLDSGASVAAQDAENGRTPLHVAAIEGLQEMVQLLIVKGADKHSFDKDQRCRRHSPVEPSAGR